jgi:intracellular septation protein A
MTSRTILEPTTDPTKKHRPHLPSRPCLKAVITRMAVNISVACIVPAVLFYVALVTIGITAAVVVALMWTYGAIAWRWATKRPMSGLLILTVSVMTIRTAFTLATGDTFVYFLQPIVSDGLVAAIFLVSLATARPVVARLAADFYPIDVDVARRPRIRRLFWHLTLMWAVVGLAKGGVGLWLLQSQSLVDFVLIKNIAVISLTGAAVVVTVWASLTVARKEGLLSPV